MNLFCCLNLRLGVGIVPKIGNDKPEINYEIQHYPIDCSRDYSAPPKPEKKKEDKTEKWEKEKPKKIYMSSDSSSDSSDSSIYISSDSSESDQSEPVQNPDPIVID